MIDETRFDELPTCPDCKSILRHAQATPDNPEFFYCDDDYCDNPNGYNEDMNVVINIKEW